MRAGVSFEAGADAVDGRRKNCRHAGIQALSRIALQCSTENKGFKGPQTTKGEGSCFRRKMYIFKPCSLAAMRSETRHVPNSWTTPFEGSIRHLAVAVRPFGAASLRKHAFTRRPSRRDTSSTLRMPTTVFVGGSAGLQNRSGGRL
jgi:hypothetical protein